MKINLDFWQNAVPTTPKNEVSIKDLFSKCEQSRSFSADLVTLTEEILKEKLHFLCSANSFIVIVSMSELCTNLLLQYSGSDH